jgi:hypothetical protein
MQIEPSSILAESDAAPCSADNMTSEVEQRVDSPNTKCRGNSLRFKLWKEPNATQEMTPAPLAESCVDANKITSFDVD